MRVEVKEFRGSPTIFINGLPVSGLMHWTKSPTEADTAFFRDAGVHFYSFMGNLFVPAPPNTSLEEMEVRDGGLQRLLLTKDNIDQTMEMLVRTDPEIKVLPRIIMNPPLWWERSNQNELMVYYDFGDRNYRRGPRSCLASTKWNTLWQEELRRTIAHFEDQWGRFIFGYHTGLGHCGEHAYQWWNAAADFSDGSLLAFRKWLLKHYGLIKNLNQSWGTDFRDFDQVALPEGERFFDAAPCAKALFQPEHDQMLIDFQIFASDLMAETLLLEAHTVKSELKRLGKTKLYGAFYGYINLVANSTQTTVGHGSLTKVLASPDVDFICGPLSYGARQNGGVSLPQMITGSITLHGKLFYNEDDTGTHLFPGPHHGYLPETAHESVQALRRNFLATWTAGGSLWWMDLYGKNWFLDPELKKEFTFLSSFAEEHMEDRGSRSEIAVFVSLKSSLFMKDTPVPLTGNLIEQQLFEIASCGAPFDLFQDEDLPLLARSGQLNQYKLCIFPNNIAPSAHFREAVEQTLKHNNRTLLWLYMPGYIDNTTCSLAAAEALTGLRFSVASQGIMPMLTECWQNEERIVYGLTRAVYPRFSADDSDAIEVGYYVNGTTIAGQPHGSGAAFVEKQFPEWKSIWSSSPGIPASMLGRIAEQAGIHLYSRRGDQIFCGKCWLGIHSKWDGPITVMLPERCQLRDMISGRIYPISDRIDTDLRRGETALWELLVERE